MQTKLQHVNQIIKILYALMLYIIAHKQIDNFIILITYIPDHANMYFHRKNKHSNVWKRTSTNSQSKRQSLFDDDFQFSQIKSIAKRSSIVTRLQLKKSTTLQKSNKPSINRPSTCVEPSQISKAKNIGQVVKIYKKQKKKTQNIMNSLFELKQGKNIQKDLNKHQLAKTQVSSTKYGSKIENQPIKVGLLGQYSRYQKLSKKQLIQKLISLQYLAQNIFKKNKYLEQQMIKMSKSSNQHIDDSKFQANQQFQL